MKILQKKNLRIKNLINKILILKIIRIKDKIKFMLYYYFILFKTKKK